MLPIDIAMRIGSAELERYSLYELIRRNCGIGALDLANENFAPAQATEEEASLRE